MKVLEQSAFTVHCDVYGFLDQGKQIVFNAAVAQTNEGWSEVQAE